MSKTKKFLFIIFITILLICSFTYLVLIKQQRDREVRFTGIVERMEDTRALTCCLVIVVNDKRVLIEERSNRPYSIIELVTQKIVGNKKGSVIGFPGAGKKVEVFAIEDYPNNFTIYGSKKYFVRVIEN